MQNLTTDLFKSDLPFNPVTPHILHIDLNSCFATIEQQANPFLRNKPIAVSAYNTPHSCILAPSIEAKKFGVKTGMRVDEGKKLCPNLYVMEPDSWKYRIAHLRLKRILESYTSKVIPKSIDEFVLEFSGTASFKRGLPEVAQEIKQRIKEDLGEWVRVSIGISTNFFLAKTAANLHKPDGLDVIDRHNFLEVYNKLELTDLCGIATNNAIRLNLSNIFNVNDFYNTSALGLKEAFHSIVGYYWYLKLRGYEAEDYESKRKSFSHSYVVPKQFSSPSAIAPILMKLIEKLCFRMKQNDFSAKSFGVAVYYRNKAHWHGHKRFQKPIFLPADVYRVLYKLFLSSPYAKENVQTLYVFAVDLIESQKPQPDLFNMLAKETELFNAVFDVNQKWGGFVIGSGLLLQAKKNVADRIAFGGVKDKILANGKLDKVGKEADQAIEKLWD